MRHTAAAPGPPRATLEHDHVARPGRLRLNEAGVPVHGDDAEHRRIERERALRIADGQRDVGQAVRADGTGHGRFQGAVGRAL